MTNPSESTTGNFRAKAEACFRLANEVSDKLLREALMNYGRELMARSSAPVAKAASVNRLRSGSHPLFNSTID